MANRKLRQFIDTHASIADLSQAERPTYLVVADLLSGREVLISTGDLVTGVLASSAIPGVLPPVEHAGTHLIDGALAPHTGITQAVDLGASVAYILSTGAACALSRAPRSAVEMALHSLTLLIQQRLYDHRVAPPPAPGHHRDHPARPGGPPVATWFAQTARQADLVDVEVVDLADIDHPLFDKPLHPRLRHYVHDHTQAWSETIDRADAYAFVIPEYNYGFNAETKKTLTDDVGVLLIDISRP